MNKVETLNVIIGLFSDLDFEKKNQEQLLSDSWKKSRMDCVVYGKRKTQIEEDPGKNVLIAVEKEELWPFCVIISTSEGEGHYSPLGYYKRIIQRVISDSAFWFGVVIDKDIHVYTDFRNEPGCFSWRKESLEDLKSIIEYYKGLSIDDFHLKDSLSEKISTFGGTTDREKLILDTIQHNLPTFKLYQYGRTFSFSLVDQFQLISDVLKREGIRPSKRFCRYTSAKSLHRIIDNEKESMCGLAVMNDKSEGFYLDACISPSTSHNIWTKPQHEIDEYNKAFITSLCDINKSDDLTMWRLYGGEDGDGVCLEYELDMDIIRKSKHLLLMPVQYGDHNNPIIDLFRVVSKLPAIMGFKFVLSFKNIFRYFVKPDDFDIEKEYRLLLVTQSVKNLVVDPPKWIFNEAYKIFHPIQELALPDAKGDKILKSPLKLKKIILGPKCKETSVNRVQLKAWLNQKGKGNIDVEESSISFYR